MTDACLWQKLALPVFLSESPLRPILLSLSFLLLVHARKRSQAHDLDSTSFTRRSPKLVQPNQRHESLLT
jgi:hypothetical protein